MAGTSLGREVVDAVKADTAGDVGQRLSLPVHARVERQQRRQMAACRAAGHHHQVRVAAVVRRVVVHPGERHAAVVEVVGPGARG